MMKTYDDARARQNLLSGYAPDSFLKPVILISTLRDGEEAKWSTALCFGKALNRDHLIEKAFAEKACYERAGWGDPREDVSDSIIIEEHKGWQEACTFHLELINKLCWEYYLEIYQKYCPEDLKKRWSLKGEDGDGE